MTTTHVIDRQLLGDNGATLDDKDYVLAVAGIGLTEVYWTSSARGPQHALGWTPHNFRIAREKYGPSPPHGFLLEEINRWQKRWSELAEKRVLIDARAFRPDDPDLTSIARILSHPALGIESLIADKRAEQADIRWEWPLRLGAFADDLGQLEMWRLADSWPSSALVEMQPLTREHARCEILVMPASVRDGLRRVLALPHRIRTGHILLFGPIDVAWHKLRGHIDALLAETQAAALSLVSVPATGEVADRINHWINEISHNVPYDFALARAFPPDVSLHVMDRRLLDQAALTNVARRIGRRLKRMAPTAALALPDDALPRMSMKTAAAASPPELGADLESHADAIPFGGESEGATGLSKVAVAERAARREAAASETERILQADLFRFHKDEAIVETRGLVAGDRYRFDVFIGPAGEGTIAADAAFPDAELDWDKQDTYRLQVLFAEPEQWDEPLRGTLVLPRQGRSSSCEFVFSPTRAGAFSGRVTLYYRGRVLQTALLNTTVVKSERELDALGQREPLRFEIETRIYNSLGSLDERRRFDACMILNDTSAGRHAMTAAGTESAFIASLDVVKPQLATINQLLTEVAYNSKRYAKGIESAENSKLLCDLALEGHVLYRNLVADNIARSSAADDLLKSEYLQIVSARHDAVVPLEFVYEYKPPKQGAKVCKNAKQALLDGHCPANCVPTDSPAEHVCPLGFWGLRKVIERHAHDPSLVHAGIVRYEHHDPLPGRNTLMLKGPSLLATSQQLPGASAKQLCKSVQTAWNGDVAAVGKWSEWKNTVKTKKPVLLVALPHADGEGTALSLEIGGDIIRSLDIDEHYVRLDPASPPPLVLLLGCDTANVATVNAYLSQVQVFRQAEAAIVLATVATVLAKDAATVAEKLVDRLAATAKNSPNRIGEVLRQVKREAVAESLMMALCLVAFGDADWKLN